MNRPHDPWCYEVVDDLVESTGRPEEEIRKIMDDLYDAGYRGRTVLSRTGAYLAAQAKLSEPEARSLIMGNPEF